MRKRIFLGLVIGFLSLTCASIVLAQQEDNGATATSSTNAALSSEYWPNEADETLPFAGIFYGNAQAGTGTTNSSISLESSRRFRAQKSGVVESVRFHNRVLTDRNIETKCSRSGDDSPWCACKEFGLDAYTCGYTIGSSYSVGNGGLIVVHVVPDDGFGFPDSSAVLGVSEQYVPLELSQSSSSQYVTLPFVQPVTIVAGEIYHLLYKNLNPPTNCALAGVPASEASSCARHQGAISINGIYDKNNPATSGRWGPMYGTRGAASLYRDARSNEWMVFDKGISFYELNYADGVAVGESYHALDALSNGQNKIQGDTVARQRFTVEDADRSVTGVWVNHGLDSSADGSAATVSLTNEAGDLLFIGLLPASDICLERAETRCRDWGYVPFTYPLHLQDGKEYSLIIRASRSAGYLLSAYRTLATHDFEDRNYWHNARAEISTDAGNSWSEWSSSNGRFRDLPVLFTIEGMPIQLP